MSWTPPTADHVLISYAIEDRAYVVALARHLADRGIKTWYDDKAKTNAQPEYTKMLVEACAAMIVVMTPAARNSARVEDEIVHARRGNKLVLPLLREGSSLVRLNDIPYEDVTGARMPSDSWSGRLDGFTSSPPSAMAPLVRTPRRRGLAAAALAVAVLTAATVVGVWLWQRTTTSESPVAAPSAPGAAGVESGEVTIERPVEGSDVGRCARVSGRANLPFGKALLVAVNRFGPPDSVWYFNYIANNGIVPKTWTASVYFGSATQQSYQVVVLVMDVKEAQAFMEAHISKDGRFATAKDLPTEPAAQLRARQTSLESC